MTLTQDFKDKCEKILLDWQTLIGKNWAYAEWKTLKERIEKGKDAILNDDFFKSFATRTPEEQKWMWKKIEEKYNNEGNKDNVYGILYCLKSVERFSDKKDLGADANYLINLALWIPQLKTNFLKMVDVNKWENSEKITQLDQYTDEDLKLFKELGIEEDEDKKECVKESYRLLEIYNKWIKDTYNTNKHVELHFAHIKKDGSKINYDKIEVKGENYEGIITLGKTYADESGNNVTYLNLDRYDFDDKFRAGMVWFTMAHELSHSLVGMLGKLGKIPTEKINVAHSLNFWKYFLYNSGEFTTNKLIKDNIKDKYWKEYFRLSLPSEFPKKALTENELRVYWPEFSLQEVWGRFPRTKQEGIDPSSFTIRRDINVPVKKSDWVWKRLSGGLIEMIDEEFKTNKYDKSNIDYIWSKMSVAEKKENEDILIRVFYRKESVLEKRINELIDIAMSEKEALTLSERQKLTNLTGMWFPLVCGVLENQGSMDELIDDNFKWISQSSSQVKEIFKEDWSAFIGELEKQVEIEVSAKYDSKYQEAIKAGKKLLEKVKSTTEQSYQVQQEVPTNN